MAYIPDQRVAGLSKLARTVEVYARRPQIQENMTAQIADALEEHLQPKGVMVMIEAEHMCMHHARCSETRQQNCDHHRARSLCGRFFPAADLFTDGKGLNLSWNSELL